MSENKDWLFVTEKGSPEKLSNISVMTEEEEMHLDQIVGKDFAIRAARMLEDSHFDHDLQEIVVSGLDRVLNMSSRENDPKKIIELFHELAHSTTDENDPVTSKISSRLEGKIRLGDTMAEFQLDTIRELILIRAERMANAYTLRKLRQLRDEQGIDMIANISPDEIIKFIDSQLNTKFKNIENTPEYKKKFGELCNTLGVEKGTRQ